MNIVLSEEKKLQKMLERTEAGDNDLRRLADEFRNYYDRLELIYKQHRRKMPIRDLTFQEEFRDTVAKLRALADNAHDFWNDTRMCYYNSDKDKFVRQHRIIIKRLKSLAVSFSRQCDELYTIYQNLNSLGKDIPLRLNWWLFESSCNDLLKISGNILFLTRDMEKYYE